MNISTWYDNHNEISIYTLLLTLIVYDAFSYESFSCSGYL